MDIESITLIFRGTTLLVVACGGILSIYLGWKLYRDGINSPVSSELSKGEQWKFTLKALGPGVFFALFGMWILVRTIDNQIMIDPVGSEPAEEQPLNEGLSLGSLLTSPAQAAEVRPKNRVCFRYSRIRMSSGEYLEPRDFQASIDEAIALLRKGDFPSEDNARLNKTIHVLTRLSSAEPTR